MRCCCCNEGDPGSRAISASPPWSRRLATPVQWVLPITTLALIPKCPACVAAYVFLFTGVGLSFPAAAATRWVLITLCVTTLGYLSIRAARRFMIRSASRA